VFQNKGLIIIFLLLFIIPTAIGWYFLGNIEQEQLNTFLKQLGIWAPLIYIIVYILVTILVLPTTPLNLSGGAIFGIWWGTLWTSLAAIIAAIVAFLFSRTMGRELIEKKLAGTWKAMDAEIHQGGLYYLFAIRLFPIIPYGLVNFAAGLTSIPFRDYLFATILGTVPGIFPFVMLGNSGLKAMKTGQILPLIFSFALMGILVGGATWYRGRRRNPEKALKELEQSSKTYDD